MSGSTPTGVVADVLNAGPLHRFATPGCLASNCLHFLARDRVTLDFIEQCGDFYEAQARAMGLWDKAEPLRSDPVLRHTIKGMGIGLGYGMSAARYSSVIGIAMEEAEKQVALYRARNKPVLALWQKLETSARMSAGKDYEIELPSGRITTYRQVTVYGGLSAILPRMGQLVRCRLWGGSLTENLCQALAREIFMFHVEQLTRAGHDILMRVHDEVVCLADEDRAEESRAEIERIMSLPPPWAKSLPLGAEAKITPRYEK